MPDGVAFDFHEIDKLAADLTEVPATIGPFLVKAFQVTAHHVKDDWADKLKGEPHLPHAPGTITYDIEATAGATSTIKAEIGAQTGRSQAPIVTVIEFGAPGNGTAPRGYGLAALHENEADFERGIARAEFDAARKLHL